MLQIELIELAQIVGGIGFKSRPIVGSIEIGYGVSTNFQNRGIATAAVTGMLQIAQRFSLVQVTAETETSNIPSQRVLQKCGFEKILSHDTQNANLIYWKKVL